jgi:hypothetical protein
MAGEFCGALGFADASATPSHLMVEKRAIGASFSNG